MKYYFLFVLVSLAACKKSKNDGNDDTKPTTILISTASTNGVVTTRFSYNANKKLSKAEFYEEAAPNALQAVMEIEYKGGNVTQATSYSEPGHKPMTRAIIDSVSNGHIIRSSAYDLQGLSPNTPSSTQTRTYNAQGLMSKLERRDKNKKVLDYINLSYYANGTLKQIDNYDASGDLLYLVEKRSFAVPGSILAKGLTELEEVLGVDYIAGFFNESVQAYTYDQSGTVLTNRQTFYAGREFNADSSLKRQTVMVKSHKPVKDDVITYKQYEYIVK